MAYLAFIMPTCPMRVVLVVGGVRPTHCSLTHVQPSLCSQVPEDTNILTDGCLIDLCGVTLMWRTAIGLEQGPVSEHLIPDQTI